MSDTTKDPIVIVSGARTPMGSFQGVLQDMTAPALGAAAIKAAMEKVNVKGEEVADVLMGCVLPAGQGQAPARQAAFGAGLPASGKRPRGRRRSGPGSTKARPARPSTRCAVRG